MKIFRRFLQNPISTAVVVVLFLLMVTGKSCMLKGKDFSNTQDPVAIAWDAYGYYMYLPATFIYQDTYLEKKEWSEAIVKKYNPSTTLYQFRPGEGNKTVILYLCGHAIIWAPGFFIAHWLAEPLGYPADGFSLPYQLSIVFTGFLVTLAGLWFLRKVLLRFYSDKITALVLILIGFGTNYFYQCGFDGTTPHNLIFFLNALLLYLIVKWHDRPKIWLAALTGLILGISVLVRPTQIIWLMVPVLWGVYSWTSLREKTSLLKKHIFHMVLFALTLTLMGMIQMIYWKFGTGNYIYYDPSETFALTDPYTFDFLFSYKKGWLLYTPIMFFSLVGIWLIIKKKLHPGWILLLLPLIHVYLVSSWECWWYAASFGSRPMVDIYPLLAIALGALISLISGGRIWLKVSITACLSALVFLNLFQTRQFIKGIIHYERMTREYYWDVFLKTEIPSGAAAHLEVDQNHLAAVFPTDDRSNYYERHLLTFDFEQEMAPDKEPYRVDTFAVSGKNCLLLDSVMQFSPAFEEPYYQITSKDYTVVQVTVQVFPTDSSLSCNGAIVVTLERNGKFYYYAADHINKLNLPSGKWSEVKVNYYNGFVRHKEDKLQIYFWNLGKSPIYIDDLKAVMFEPKITW